MPSLPAIGRCMCSRSDFARRPTGRAHLVRHRHGALDSADIRIVQSLADVATTGMLAITPDQAFSLLHAHCRDNHRRLSDVDPLSAGKLMNLN